MKQATLEQFVQDTENLVATSQREKVVLTRNGKPVALVLGIEDKYDAEDWYYMTSPEFWRMIELRRQEGTNPLNVVEERLFTAEESQLLQQHDQEIPS